MIRQRNIGHIVKLVAPLLAVFISSCGGGGKSSTEQAPETQAFTTSVDQYTIDSSLASSSIAQRISTISSPLDEAGVNNSLKANSKTSNLIIAADATDTPILLALSGRDTKISVSSTARALAYVLAATIDRPNDVDLSILRSEIELSQFIDLEAAIQQSIDAGQIPIDSEKVLSETSNLIYSALARIDGKLSAPANAQRLSAQAINVSSVDYDIFNESQATSRIWLSEGPANGVSIKNRTFLTWKAATSSSNSFDTPTYTKIPPLSVTLKQLLFYYAGSESITDVTSGNHFYLKVYQDKETERENITRMVSSLIFAIVDVSTAGVNLKPSQAEKCALTIAKDLFASATFVDLVANPSSENFAAYAKDLGGRVYERINLCSTTDPESPSTGQSNIEKLVNSKFMTRFNRALQILTVTRTATRSFGSFWQYINHARDSYELELCEYSSVIRPCVRRIAINSAAVTTSPGETVNFNYSTFGDGNSQIVPTPNLYITSDNTSIFTVVGYTNGVASIKGVAPGEATLSLIDPVTGVELKQVPVLVGSSSSVKINSASCDFTLQIPCIDRGICGNGTNDGSAVATRVTASATASGPIGSNLNIAQASNLGRIGDWALVSCGSWSLQEDPWIRNGGQYPLTSHCVRELGQPAETEITASLGYMINPTQYSSGETTTRSIGLIINGSNAQDNTTAICTKP